MSEGNHDLQESIGSKEIDTKAQDFKDLSKATVKWKALSSLLIATVAIVVAQIIGLLGVAGYILLTDSVSFTTALANTENQLAYYFSSYLIAEILAVLAVYYYVKYKGGSWRDLGFRSFNWLKAIGWLSILTMGFLLIASVAVAVGEVLFPSVDFTEEQPIGFLGARSVFEMVLAFFALVVIAPISEETIFRGFLLPAFSNWVGVIWAVIFTSLLFGLLHPPIGAMVVITVLAVFLAIAYIRLNSIWPAIILHSGKNLVAYILIFGVL